MEKDRLANQDPLTIRILTFLGDHSSHCYTVKELASERYVSGNTHQIRHRIKLLVAKGLVKAKSIDSEQCYQVVSVVKG
jgi:hypothetical protein